MSTEPTSLPTVDMISDLQTNDTDHNHTSCPAPLDCDDLAETFRTDMTAAVYLLLTLTPTQLNLQALAYAAYLNQLHGLALDLDDILAGWQQQIERVRHTT